MHPGAEEKAIVSAPGDLQRKNSDPLRGAKPEVRQPQHGDPEGTQRRLLEQEIGWRRHEHRPEVDSDGWARAGAERDRSGAVDHDPARPALDPQAVASQSIAVQRHYHAAVELEPILPRVEL